MSKIGIIAGRGRFPLDCARAVKNSGNQVIALAIRGFADGELAESADEIYWFEVGQVGKLINTCLKLEIRQVTMAGKIDHINLMNFKQFDARAVKLLLKLPDKRAETVITALIDEFAKEGIQVMDSAAFLRDALPKPELLTKNCPLSRSDDKDVYFAYPLAKQIAGLDIGQTLIVKNQIIVAVEGIEGTDDCIRRAAQYAGEGIVVVKVSRPEQDFRFDLPVIGLDTIKVLREVKASALAISAGECLFFDQPEAIALAEKCGISIIAI